MTAPLDPSDLNYMPYAGMSSDEVARDIQRRSNEAATKQVELEQMRDEFSTNPDPALSDEITRLTTDIGSQKEVIDAGERLLTVWPSTTEATTATPVANAVNPENQAQQSLSKPRELKKLATAAVALIVPPVLLLKPVRRALGISKDKETDAVNPANPGEEKKPFWTRNKKIAAAAAGAVIVVGAIVNTNLNDGPDLPADPNGLVTGEPVAGEPTCDLTEELAVDEADKSFDAVEGDAIGAIEIAKAGLADSFGDTCDDDQIEMGGKIAADRIQARAETEGANVPAGTGSERTTTEPETEIEPDAEVYCETDSKGGRSIAHDGELGSEIGRDIPGELWEGRACDVDPGEQVDVAIPGGKVVREIGR